MQIGAHSAQAETHNPRQTRPIQMVVIPSISFLTTGLTSFLKE